MSERAAEIDAAKLRDWRKKALAKGGVPSIHSIRDGIPSWAVYQANRLVAVIDRLAVVERELASVTENRDMFRGLYYDSIKQDARVTPPAESGA